MITFPIGSGKYLADINKRQVAVGKAMKMELFYVFLKSLVLLFINNSYNRIINKIFVKKMTFTKRFQNFSFLVSDVS